MFSNEFWESTLLLFFLLNPFFMSIYLIDIFQSLEANIFRRVLVRGSVIATLTFLVFAYAGEKIFTDILQARFASFLIFGGIIFLLIAIRFVFDSESTMKILRGTPEHISGSIAMPFMIGPGTIMASVLAGGKLPYQVAASSLILAVVAAVLAILFLKFCFDYVKKRNEKLIQRYVIIVGRMMSLAIGTFAVEMIVKGVESIFFKSF